MSIVDDLITVGLSEVGKPYNYGAEGPSSFDCSGLMQFAFAKVGVKLPRTADQQYKYTSPVTSPAAGDLVFWVNNAGVATHVALYLGGGKVLSAPHTGAVVHTGPLFQEPNETRHYGRVPGLGGAVGTIVAPVAAVGATAVGWTTSAINGVLGGAKGIALEGVGALAALVLIGLGAYRLAAPQIKKQTNALESAL